MNFMLCGQLVIMGIVWKILEELLGSKQNQIWRVVWGGNPLFVFVRQLYEPLFKTILFV